MVRLGHNLALLGLAYFFIAAGTLMLAWSAYQFLAVHLSPAQAGLILGACLGAVGGLLLWLIQRNNR